MAAQGISNYITSYQQKYNISNNNLGHAVAQLVEAIYDKPEGHRFDYR
jgi:hypothetical protein